MPRDGFFFHAEQDSAGSERTLTAMASRREQTLMAGRPAHAPQEDIYGNRTLWDRLSDVLTAEQKVRLETFGFVVVPDVLSPAEVQVLLDAAYGVEEAYQASEPLPQPCWLESDTHEYFRANNIIHLDPAFFNYFSNPTVVSMAQHAIGHLRPRLTESELHIRRQPAGGLDEYDFHRGTWFDGSTIDGWYRYPIVKALTFLTDLGPEDGGTVAIPGTHKLAADSDLRFVTDTAVKSPSLIAVTSGSAGSTLLFFQSLIHSTGIIRSGRDRVFLVSGYAPMMFQAMSGHEPHGELLSKLPSDYYEFIDGSRTYLI
jgi:hypothetical protein